MPPCRLRAAAQLDGLADLDAVANLMVLCRADDDSEPDAAKEPFRPRSQIDQFDQFQSLRTMVPLQSRLVCVTDKESLAAEKFRFLAVRLRQMRQTRPLKKILVTSSVPQEGKSTVAANLACTLARRARQRTLLLDGDLRRPSLSNIFGLGNFRGSANGCRETAARPRVFITSKKQACGFCRLEARREIPLSSCNPADSRR